MASLSHTRGHDRRVRRVSVLLPGLLLVLGLLGGCGGDDKPAPATGPGLPPQAELKKYFEGITSGDPEVIAAASGIAADGSLAQGYVSYVGAAATAAAATGQPVDAADVEEVDGGFKACASADQCVTWSDLAGKDGKLADFAVNDARLDTELVDLTGQPPIESAGLYEVQPEWAYRRPISGALNVVVGITASALPLTSGPGIYVENDQVLKGAKPDKPVTVGAGKSQPVLLVFPGASDAKLDGQVTFDLRLNGKGSEPIGFGLTAPAG
jgi:hypothetical protein